MSLKAVRAIFACDGCDQEFIITIPNDGDLPKGTVFELAEEGLAGMYNEVEVVPRAPHKSRREAAAATHGLDLRVSKQGEHHLCPKCTDAVDAAIPEDVPDSAVTRDQVVKILKADEAKEWDRLHGQG